MRFERTNWWKTNSSRRPDPLSKEEEMNECVEVSPGAASDFSGDEDEAYFLFDPRGWT